MRNFLPRTAQLVSILVVGLFFIAGPVSGQSPSSPPALANDYAQSLSNSFETVANGITPSVVSISAIKKPKKISGQRKQLGENPFDPFRDFFGGDPLSPFQAPDDGGQQGLGTGVVVDEKGYILTNNHVVGEADELTVVLNDKRRFKAQIVGRDPKTDIAVIKINASNLSAARLGDSDKLKIGEWVIACGNPFGLSNSITAGIVSAKGRSISRGGQFEDFIQTDAAINPGNSGGPLLNLKGEVVGINTAIFSRSGGYMGIGFAIPIGMARSVMESLITKGKVIRGWLGVSIQNLTEDLSKSFAYPEGTEGALVGSVSAGSPAAKAGVLQEDIITGFNGTKITDVNQLRNLVASTSPGQNVSIEVFRDKQKKTLTVKVDELTGQDEEMLAQEEKLDSSADLGIDLQTLTPELARQLRTKKTSGVIVTNVQPGGLADSAGLLPRDIILSVNKQGVKSVKDLLSLVTEKSLREGIRLIVETQGMEHFVFLKSEE